MTLQSRYHISWGCNNLKAWLELENPYPRQLTHMAVDKKVQFSAMWPLLMLMHSYAIMLSSSRVRDLRDPGWGCLAFYKVNIPLCPIYAIHSKWVTMSPLSRAGELNSTSCRKEYHRICGHSLKPSPAVYGFTIHTFIKSKDLLSHK